MPDPRGVHLPVCVLALAAVIAAAAPVAHAATAQMTNGTTIEGRGYTVETSVVNFRAAPRERNRLAISVSGRTATLVDPAGIEPGQGCARPNTSDRTLVTCEFRAGPPSRRFQQDGFYNFAAIDLGDGDDSARIPLLGDEPFDVAAGTPPVVAVDGGPGNDDIASAATSILRGGSGNDGLAATVRRAVMVGGPGADHLTGGPADDFFDGGRRADGPDRMVGAGGTDLASYAERRRAVRGDMAGDADDGQRGERDRIGRDVENFDGGRGDDRLRGSGAANVLRGNGGDDVLDGRVGPDTLSGGGGNDRLQARDGELDSVRCGRGRDRAGMDGTDLPRACERTTRSSPARALPDLDAAYYVRRRAVDFFLVCPDDGPRRCVGRARVLAGGREHGSRRFSIRRGGGGGSLFTIRVGSTIDPLFGIRGSVDAIVEIRTRGRRGRTLIARWSVAIPR